MRFCCGEDCYTEQRHRPTSVVRCSFLTVWPSVHKQNNSSQFNLNWTGSPKAVWEPWVGMISRKVRRRKILAGGGFPGRAKWKQEDERGWNLMSGCPQASQIMSQDLWARKPWQNQKGMSFFVSFFNTLACLFPSLLWSSVTSINIIVKTSLSCGCPRKRSFSLAWTRALKGSDVPLLGDQYGCDTS